MIAVVKYQDQLVVLREDGGWESLNPLLAEWFNRRFSGKIYASMPANPYQQARAAGLELGLQVEWLSSESSVIGRVY